MSDLFGTPEGKRTERVEWGQRSLADNFLIGPKGAVRAAPGEEAARGHGTGSFYPGGPRWFEPVRRVVVTYVGEWEAPDA